MKVKVIGKTNLSGTSKKTGKDYNINMVYELTRPTGLRVNPVRKSLCRQILILSAISLLARFMTLTAIRAAML